MDSPAPLILIIVGVIALFVVIAVVSHRLEKQRREMLAALAAKIGFSFDPSSTGISAFPYLAFRDLFDRGHSRRAFNTMRGQTTIDNRRFGIVCGDYLFKETQGSGKNRRTVTHRISYLILELPFRNTPSLAIRAENFLDRIAGAIGFDDIDFESAEFSRQFHVSSSDKRFAYDVIDARMMEFLLSRKPCPISVAHGACLIASPSRWKPEQFEEHLRFAADFFDHWPNHVTRSLESVQPQMNTDEHR